MSGESCDARFGNGADRVALLLCLKTREKQASETYNQRQPGACTPPCTHARRMHATLHARQAHARRLAHGDRLASSNLMRSCVPAAARTRDAVELSCGRRRLEAATASVQRGRQGCDLQYRKPGRHLPDAMS